MYNHNIYNYLFCYTFLVGCKLLSPIKVNYKLKFSREL